MFDASCSVPSFWKSVLISCLVSVPVSSHASNHLPSTRYCSIDRVMGFNEPTGYLSLSNSQTARGFRASDYNGVGLIIIKRLHRMVRHGFRPLLGYGVASAEDQDIHLRRGSEVATIHPDGAVWFVFKVPLQHSRADSDGNLYHESFAVFADDSENFDALFPANSTPPRRGRFVRRLYELGF